MRTKWYRFCWLLIFLITNFILVLPTKQTLNADYVNDDVCIKDPEDAERARFMEMPSEDQETLINSSEDVSLLSREEKETLLEMSKKDFGLVETCKDNRKLFNETVFNELNLLHIFDSQEGPQLLRNYTSFAVLGLDWKKVACKYSLIKSDVHDVDDSKHDIPLNEEQITLEGHHNTVGVVCAASIVDLQHLLDPDIVELVVDCGNHTAVNCSQCSSERSGCNGQCEWINDKCSEAISRSVEMNQENEFVETNQENKLDDREESKKLVNCGAHKAYSCSDCGSSKYRCNGECAWIADHCADPKQVGSTERVHCGSHKADNCKECGSVATRCNGECIWTGNYCAHPKDLGRKKQFKKDPKEVIEFYFDVFMFIHKSNASMVNCGGHIAVQCSQCSSERRGCDGQCVWMDNGCTQGGHGNVPAYSVLIFILDSVSKFSFSRNLPKTLEYLKSQGGIALNNHHKQGECTYPNYVPLLAGVLDVKGNFRGTMDNITEKHQLSWAWEDWKNAGLPTLYHDDMPQFGPFYSYGREGWEYRSPFMHDHRSGYHAMDSNKYDIRNGALPLGFQCMGNTPSYKRQLALLRMFARTYKDVPKFAKCNLCEYSHDTINLVRVMDDDLLHTFQYLIEGGFTKRTLMIVMGDHGRTYGIPGKAGWLDGNSPMMMLLLPDALKEEMPGVTDTVLENSWKMTTFQDIYKTITDPVITRRESEGNTGTGGLSLLHPIPSRSCEEASVPEAHCTCRQDKLDTTDPTLIKHTKEVVREINQRVGSYSQCHPLELQRVEWAWRDGRVYHIQLFAQIEKQRVNCGGHKADSCLKCGTSPTYCNGECKWTDGYCAHPNQVIRDGVFSFHAVYKEESKESVTCGGHRADSCLECGTQSTRCNGECIWKDSHCTHRDQASRDEDITAILRNDFYSTTSSCIEDNNLKKIKPFCICRH